MSSAGSPSPSSSCHTDPARPAGQVNDRPRAETGPHWPRREPATRSVGRAPSINGRDEPGRSRVGGPADRVPVPPEGTPCRRNHPAPARRERTPPAPTTPTPVTGCAPRCTCPSTSRHGPPARAAPAGRTAAKSTGGSPRRCAPVTRCAGATRRTNAVITTSAVAAYDRATTLTTGHAQESASSSRATTLTTLRTVEASASSATGALPLDTLPPAGIV
jgi:hypothetical protein